MTKRYANSIKVPRSIRLIILSSDVYRKYSTRRKNRFELDYNFNVETLALGARGILIDVYTRMTFDKAICSI